jgi:hypothetical protein
MAKDFGAERQRMRGLCLHASELIDELQRMYPQTMPDLSASDRELGAHVGTRQLVALLVQFRAEAEAEAGPLGRVIQPQ